MATHRWNNKDGMLRVIMPEYVQVSLPELPGRKSAPLPESDPLGERVEIVNAERRTEWLEYPYYPDMTFPLNICLCGNSIWKSGVAIKRNGSNIFAMELVTAGNVAFMQNGRSYLVEAGQLFILRRGANHSYCTGPAGYAHKRIVGLAGGALDAILSNLGLAEVDLLTISHTADFIRIVKTGSRLLKERKPGFMARLSELAYSILLFIGEQKAPMPLPVPVKCAIDFMNQHITGFVTLKELSGAVSLSIPHFCRLFQQHLGAAPLAYFRSLKIKHAKQLLMNTTTQINEISRMFGYQELSNFTNFFTRETGMSPKEFRNKASKY